MDVKNLLRLQQFISFQLHGGVFGFDIRLVKEITPAIQITPVPLKVCDVSGVVNIRGQVVVVLDIGLSLGGMEQVITDDSQIIILKTTRELESVSDFTPNFAMDSIGDIPVGFLVECVGDIVAVDPSCIEEAPPHLIEKYRSFVEGIVRQESAPLIVLNAGEILRSEP